MHLRSVRGARLGCTLGTSEVHLRRAREERLGRRTSGASEQERFSCNSGASAEERLRRTSGVPGVCLAGVVLGASRERLGGEPQERPRRSSWGAP